MGILSFLFVLLEKRLFVFFYIVEMQRTRKDCETLSSSRFSTVSSVGRESDRLRLLK